MTAARRILRRLVRRVTKPLRLAVVRAQLATAEQNLDYYEGVRVEAANLKQQESLRQVRLMAQRQAIERGVA